MTEFKENHTFIILLRCCSMRQRGKHLAQISGNALRLSFKSQEVCAIVPSHGFIWRRMTVRHVVSVEVFQSTVLALLKRQAICVGGR